MLKRWFPCLLSVMLGLLLLPSAALAQNRTAGWGKGRSAANTNSRNNGNYRARGWRNPNRAGARHGGWGYCNSGYNGNPNYRQGGYRAYSDRDGDGDHDYWRHRHYRRHRWDDDDDDDGGYYGGWRHRGWPGSDNGWYNSGWYGPGWYNNGWYDNGRYDNGRWHRNTPPGWRHGRKTGWGNSDLPPGQAKKQGGWW